MLTIGITYISSKSFRNFVSTARFYKVYAPYLLARNTKHKQYNGADNWSVCAGVFDVGHLALGASLAQRIAGLCHRGVCVVGLTKHVIEGGFGFASFLGHVRTNYVGRRSCGGATCTLASLVSTSVTWT